jgi:hypothetical protein
VKGQIVNFKVTQGGGSVFAGAAISDDGGIARERWTMGTGLGMQSLEARAVDSAGSPIVFATFTATAVADMPVSISVISGNNQTGDPGTALPLPVSVKVLDRYGNPVMGTMVQFSVKVGSGSAAPASPLTDTKGEATTVWTLGDEIGGPELAVNSGTASAAVSANTPCPNTMPVLEGTGATCSLARVNVGTITVTARIPACGTFPMVGLSGSSPASGAWWSPTDGVIANPQLPGCFLPCANYSLAPVDVMVFGLQQIPSGTHPLTVNGLNGSTIHSSLTIDSGAGAACTL